jgi:hypothetical protein
LCAGGNPGPIGLALVVPEVTVDNKK